MKKFWCVFRHLGDNMLFLGSFPSHESAKGEAERLARTSPGHIYLTMELTGFALVEEPPVWNPADENRGEVSC